MYFLGSRGAASGQAPQHGRPLSQGRIPGDHGQPFRSVPQGADPPPFLYAREAVLRIRIRIRIHVFLGLPDPDPLVKGMDPDPNPSIIQQK
jgi:hypothetical protein